MMTVGIDNPAFEDFLDSEDETRVDENSNELNSTEKNAHFKIFFCGHLSVDVTMLEV